eukprot:6476557-Amphidinium_carterae.1
MLYKLGFMDPDGKKEDFRSLITIKQTVASLHFLQMVFQELVSVGGIPSKQACEEKKQKFLQGLASNRTEDNGMNEDGKMTHLVGAETKNGELKDNLSRAHDCVTLLGLQIFCLKVRVAQDIALASG